MSQLDTVLIFLLALGVIAILAHRVNLSYPIAFIVGGMALAGLMDIFPVMERHFAMPPELILKLFLPVLLMEAAYFTSLRELMRNIVPVLQLSVGLVIATFVGVAFACHWLIPGMTLGAAFVLGAVISPPDAVAATSVFKNIRVPKRIMNILEGESLINDATGLILYRFAVLAVVTGSFSIGEMSLTFLWMVASGIIIGALLGYGYVRLFPFIKEPTVEILSTFMLPYAAWLAAESVHGSAVLAVVVCGMTVGWFAPMIFSPTFRIPAEAVWRMVVFVFNGFVFLLIGFEFPNLLLNLKSYSPLSLIGYGLVASLAAIFIRFAYIYALAYVAPYVIPKLKEKDAYPPWQNIFIVCWTGMRGVVSLATALALPYVIEGGAPFPNRDLIIFLAFFVILVTLVLQGISLPWLLKKLNVIYEFSFLYEEWTAQKEGVQAALARLESVTPDEHSGIAHQRITAHYRHRLETLGDGPNTPLVKNEAPTPVNHPMVQAEQRIWQEVLEVERTAVIRLRQAFEISDDVMHELLRDIDLRHNLYRSA